MLPVTVAVLMIVEPADATTWPVIVTSTVPPGFRRRIRQRTSGAVDDAAVPAADGAVGDDLGGGDARRLEALRAVHDDDVVGAGRRVVRDAGSCR